MKFIIKYFFLFFLGVNCTYSQSVVITPKKKIVKKYFKLAHKEWTYANKYSINKETIGQFICNNDDSAYFINDTIKCYTFRKYFNEDYPENELELKINFRKKHVLLYTGNIGNTEPTKGWSEGLCINYYCKFLNIKSFTPKYFLYACKGKTIMTIKRFGKPNEIFYIYKIEEQKNPKLDGINYIFTFIRIRK